MAINHGSLSAELTPRGVVGGRVQNSVIAYENDYERLINKPSVNNVELDGDLSLEDLGIVNNVQPNWEQDDTEAEDYIKNKPYIPENLSDLNDDSDHRTVTDAEKTTWDNKSNFSGSYNDLTDKPVIPDAQIQSDWGQNDNTKADFIKNKPVIPSAQVQSDWNESDSSKADFIKNKPSIPTALADLTDDSTHRTVTDTEKTAWNSGEANVQSNWNETDTTSDAYIQNKPSIPSVTANPGSTTATLSSIGIDGTNYAISGGSGGGAVDSVNGKTGDVVLDAEDVGALPDDTPLFSGNYNDLSNKPTIPTVNNSTITIQKNGQNVDTFTLNQATNKAIDIPVPTKTSDITNDSSFITNTVNNLANYYLKSETYTKTEVSNLIDAAVNGRFEKVQTLPVTGEANVIYLVPKTTALTNNVYDEYIWQDNAWELLGSTEIDLSGYVTDTDLTTALADYVTTSAFNTAIVNYYTKTEVGNLLDSKVDKVSGKGLSTNDYDNTAKGIVDGVTAALADKVDKVAGKGLSTNDYTTAEKNKVATIDNKADKVSSPTSGNLASLDSTGNLADSGWASDKTTTSATGNPISISGLKSNQLAINPVITLEPIQAGSGDPSPSNVRAISGYDKIEVLSCGKNLCDEQWRQGDYDSYSTLTSLRVSIQEDSRIHLKAGVTYYFYNGQPIIWSAALLYNKYDTTYFSKITWGGSAIRTYTPDIDCYIAIVFGKDGGGDISVSEITKFMVSTIEITSASDYEPYNKSSTDLSLQIGQTVYGGSLDLRTGVLTVDKAGVDLGDLNYNYSVDGVYFLSTNLTDIAPASISWPNNNITCSCYKQASDWADLSANTGINNIIDVDDMQVILRDTRYTDVASFKTAIAGQKLVYKIATPYTIQLTPHEISLLKDYAYVSTNGTNIQFSYKNGEMASLADVENLGKTMNLLGDRCGTKMIGILHGITNDEQYHTLQLSKSWDTFSLINVYVHCATWGSAYLSMIIPTAVFKLQSQESSVVRGSSTEYTAINIKKGTNTSELNMMIKQSGIFDGNVNSIYVTGIY